jgi:hypothetical protein
VFAIKINLGNVFEIILIGRIKRDQLRVADLKIGKEQ